MAVVRDVLVRTWQTAWQPSVVLPSAVATLGWHFAYQAVDTGQGFWAMPMRSMELLVPVVCLWFWLELVASASALRLMRSEGRSRRIYWVSPTVAFEVAVVTMTLTVGVVIGLALLIVPGIVLALRWSLAPLVILDAEAMWLESAGASGERTYGHLQEILVLWLVLGYAFGLGAWLVQMLGEFSVAVFGSAIMAQVLNLVLLVGANTFALVMTVSIYYELNPADQVASDQLDGEADAAWWARSRDAC